MSNPDWSVEALDGRVNLKGLLRLPTPEAYEPVFRAARAWLGRPDGDLVLDIGEVVLMNSSGIRALASLVLEAKRLGRKMILRGRSGVPWQRKTLASLQGIHEGMRIELG